jgi:hypothetical protein
VPFSRTIGPISTDSPKLMAVGNALKIKDQDFSNFDLDISNTTGNPSRKRGSLGTVDSRKKSTGRGNLSDGRHKNVSNKSPSQNKRSE